MSEVRAPCLWGPAGSKAIGQAFFTVWSLGEDEGLGAVEEAVKALNDLFSRCSKGREKLKTAWRRS